MKSYAIITLIALSGLAGCTSDETPTKTTATAPTTAATTTTKTVAPPSFSISPDEASDKLRVEMAASNADWGRLQVRAVTCTGAADGRVWIGGEPAGTTHVSKAGRSTAASTPLLDAGANCSGTATPEMASPTAANMLAADFIQFCGAGSVTNVKVEIRDIPANVVAYTYTFTVVTNCT